MDKAFDRVLREVMRWAMGEREDGGGEWGEREGDWAHSSGNFRLAKCAKDSTFILAF